MRAVRLAALSQQNLVRMGVQQARVHFFSLVTSESTAAATIAGRCTAGSSWRRMSQLSAADHEALSAPPPSSAFPSLQSQREEIERFLKQHDIHVRGKGAPPPILRFEESSLPKHLLNMVLSQFPAPTPIQAQAGLIRILLVNIKD
jgi:hypothetical protein